MRCKRFAWAIVFCAAATARADDVKLASVALLAEPGQIAPAVELRSIAEDGAMWRASVNGWSLSLARERPTGRGLRSIVEVTATPYDAHSSRRVYRDGIRRRDLEFDDAAFTVRAALRGRLGRHASVEPSFVAGYERIGAAAPAALRDAWRRPFVGVSLTQRIRYVTADDPLLARIDGVDGFATVEAYRGSRTWGRVMAAESGGATRGRVHWRESLALFGGAHLDAVSAFLAGGSWDVIGPAAVYGRRYAELRSRRGAIAGAGADVAVSGTLDAGVRASVYRGDAGRTTGTMLLLTRHAAGLRLTAGVGRSARRTIVTAVVGGAMFRR